MQLAGVSLFATLVPFNEYAFHFIYAKKKKIWEKKKKYVKDGKKKDRWTRIWRTHNLLGQKIWQITNLPKNQYVG